MPNSVSRVNSPASESHKTPKKRRIKRRTAVTEPRVSKKARNEESDADEEYTPRRSSRRKQIKIEEEDEDVDPTYVAPVDSEGSTDADEEGEEDIIEDFEDEEIAKGTDETTEENPASGEGDIYNFETQSLQSNKFKKNKNSGLTKAKNRGKPAPVKSGGSNIYSVIATSLKTKSDLDHYTNFLKSKYLNIEFDLQISELCKPSVQQCSMFYGPSASLQSLISRINNSEVIVDILKTFMSLKIEDVCNKPTIILPAIHQSLFNVMTSSDYGESFPNSNVSIRPCYKIDPRVSCLTNPVKEEALYSAFQLSFLNISNMPGRFGGMVDQIVIPGETYELLLDKVSSSIEEVRSYAENIDVEDNMTNPDLTRIQILLDSNGVFLGIILSDIFEKSDVVSETCKHECKFLNTSSLKKRSSSGCLEIESSTYDDVFQTNLNINENSIHIIDGIIGTLNSKSNLFMVIGFPQTARPPFPKSSNFINKVYSATLINENIVTHKAHGVEYEPMYETEGRYKTDPRKLNEEKGYLVLPDLLFHSIRKVASRELLSTSGSSITSALVAAHVDNSSRRTKYMILDKYTNYLTAVAIELPIILNLAVEDSNMIIIPGKTTENYLQDLVKDLNEEENNTDNKYNVVVINGIMYAMKIDPDHYSIEEAIELLPASFEDIYPISSNLSHTGCAASGIHSSKSSVLEVYNSETKSSTSVKAIYYPNDKKISVSTNVNYFCSKVMDIVMKSPVSISIYDAVLRLSLKVTSKVLARQHRLTYLQSNQDNDKPFALPEYWSICNFCLKEFKSVNGLFIHELRHFNCGKYRCDQHGMCFQDKNALDSHMLREHGGVGEQKDGEDSDPEEESNNKKSKSGEDQLTNVLAQVFSSKLLSGTTSIQCQNCKDYFPSADMLSQHLPVCDNISFFIRTPFPKVADAIKKEEVKEDEDSLPNPGWCVCGLCGYQVPTTEMIGLHFLESHLKCKVCEATHRNLEELSNHYVTHIESADPSLLLPPKDEEEKNTDDFGSRIRSIMSCEICSNFQATQSNFYYHQWIEHGVVHPPLNHTAIETQQSVPSVSKPPRKRVQLKCKFCEEDINVSGSEYVDHLSKVHGLRVEPHTVCKICFEVTSTVTEMSDHIGTHHALSGEYANCGIQTVFSCMHCVFYAFHNSMVFHYKCVHGENRPEMFECMHCHERFKDRCVWQKHITSHTESYNYACRECDRTFRLRSSLVLHIKNHHPDDQKGPTKCEYCGLVYPKPLLLRQHIRVVHSNQLPFACLDCHRRYRTETELRRHQKELHSGSVRCEVCNKMCINLKNYAFHRKKHFRVRIYQCNDCNASFKSKSAMKRHIRVVHLHLGPERFECQICGKVVTQIGMHMLTHKGSRFECEFCGKGFTKSAYYNEHMRIHRGELPFECHICKKRFNKKSNLNVHLKFHEKHRDADGNYLELRPRGRISMIFGDAYLTPEQRLARQNASLLVVPPTEHISVGPNLPGAFNVGGDAWAAAKACKSSTGLDYEETLDGVPKADDLKSGAKPVDRFDAMRLEKPIPKVNGCHKK